MLFFLAACANPLPFWAANPDLHRHEENILGEHTTLGKCSLHQLQSDARSFMRILQFRMRADPATHVAEIHAFDLRYLPNVYATNSPTNPDAVAVTIETDPENLPYSPRNQSGEPVYAFTMTLRQIDDQTVHAAIKGDPYLSNVAWDILKHCVSERTSSSLEG